MAENVFSEAVLRVGELVLRPFGDGDVEATQAACSDAVAQRWLPLARPYTREHAEEWCLRSSHAVREAGAGIHFAIADGESDRLLGAVGLRRMNWRTLCCEVGYWVAPWARGRGVASAAVGELARWALEEKALVRVELRAASRNRASLGVARRAGFVGEGVMRRAGLAGGEWVDMVLFSRIGGDV